MPVRVLPVWSERDRTELPKIQHVYSALQGRLLQIAILRLTPNLLLGGGGMWETSQKLLAHCRPSLRSFHLFFWWMAIAMGLCLDSHCHAIPVDLCSDLPKSGSSSFSGGTPVAKRMALLRCRGQVDSGLRLRFLGCAATRRVVAAKQAGITEN